MPAQARVNPRNFRFALATVVTGTAQLSAAAKNDIVLAVADAAADDDYNQMLVVITFHGTGGPPIGQRAIITNYDAASKTASIRCLDTADRLWTSRVQIDTTYAIHAVLWNEPFIGLSAGGNVNAIILANSESNKDGYYNDLDLEVVGGVGAQLGHLHRIVKYTGAARIAYVVNPLSAVPDGTTRYKIQGHLYHPVTALKAIMSTGGNIRYSVSPGGVALGRAHTSPSIDETELGNLSYLELAGEAAGDIELYRTE